MHPQAKDSNFSCWAPHGDCDHGALLRCTHSGGHVWPFYGALPAINMKYAELVWWWAEQHPRGS